MGPLHTPASSRLSSITSGIVIVMLVASGCGEGEAGVDETWDACAMLSAADLPSVGEPWTRKRGAGDVRWRGRFAESRCDHAADVDGATDPLVAIFARASALDDRTAVETKDLVARAGFRVGENLAVADPTETPGLTGGFWAFSDTPAAARAELHLFLTARPTSDAGAARPLHGHVILFASALPAPPRDGGAAPAGDANEGNVQALRGIFSSVARRAHLRMQELLRRPASADGGAPTAPDGASGDGGDGPRMDAGLRRDAGLPSEIEGFAARAADLLCTKIIECCSEAERAGGSASRSVGGCRDTTRTALAVTLSPVPPAAAAGRITFDESAARACLDGFAAQPCASARAAAAGLPCLGAFVPRVPPAGACTSDLECTTGRCRWEAGAGVCAPRAAIGQACATDADCEAGAACSSMRTCQAHDTPDARWCRGL